MGLHDDEIAKENAKIDADIWREYMGLLKYVGRHIDDSKMSPCDKELLAGFFRRANTILANKGIDDLHFQRASPGSWAMFDK